MVKVIAVWCRGYRTWTFDCPCCGKTNHFWVKMADIPASVRRGGTAIVIDVECWKCHEREQVFCSLASRRRSRK